MKRRRVQLTVPAEVELYHIWRYVAEQSGSSRADALIVRLRAACDLIGSMGGIGHPYSHRIPRIRIYSVLDYVVIYRLEETRVIVLHVVHGARDLDRIVRHRK
ncbi:MAG TPA: type II toxin-antitoxin system RelE/ParE family toxin [Phycisphaerales bacterium]|nr:type II toxin-antitoxin system RelE/ParE family toxin [Phycisphaerales bacterium]